MATQNEDRDFSQTECFDPFPEPHTIPSGWDLSGLLPNPQTTSAAEEDNTAESQAVIASDGRVVAPKAPRIETERSNLK